MSVESKTQASILSSLTSFFSSIQSVVTDFNTGSVILNIFNSISLAISGLYAQLENVYNASFISTATGSDLDNRVADFFITRDQATFSFVQETFFTTSFTPNSINIPSGTIVSTLPTTTGLGVQFQTTSTTIFNPIVSNYEITFQANTFTYPLGNRQVSSITSVTGTYLGSTYTFTQGTSGVGDYYLNNSNLAQAYIVWNTQVGAKNPDVDTTFNVNYNALSIDVIMQATTSGSSGDVAPFSLFTITNPPAGIDGAENYVAARGGTNQETDEHLRQRVVAFLQSLARATAPALIAQAESVPGVVSATIVQPLPPQGYVIIVPDDGTGNASPALQTAVVNAIYGTQASNAYNAAGIVIQVRAPLFKIVNVTAAVTFTSATTLSAVQQAISTALNTYFGTLQIGQTVLRSEVIFAIMGVANVTNMNLSNLIIETTDIPPVGGTTGDVPVPPNYTAVLGTVTISPF